MDFFRLETEIGPIGLEWGESGLVSRVSLGVSECPPGSRCVREGEIPASARVILSGLRRYFKTGEPMDVSVVETIDRATWSPFQSEVYSAVVRIPHGETRTYGWVAYQLGKAGAMRAVGQALRNNPVAILVPCHRVVSTQSLGGFMGSADPSQPELVLKRKLLALEDHYRNPCFSFVFAGALG